MKLSNLETNEGFLYRGTAYLKIVDKDGFLQSLKVSDRAFHFVNIDLESEVIPVDIRIEYCDDSGTIRGFA